MTKTPFTEQFRHYLVPDEQTIKEAFSRHSLIVLDSNVLLNVYRFAPKARGELMSVIDKLKNLIWIPHQVGLEFFRNRVGVMSELSTSYAALLREIDQAERRLDDELTEKINQLSNRTALPDDQKKRLLAGLKDCLKPLAEDVTVLSREHGLTTALSDDPVLTQLEAMLSGRIGSSFTPEEHEEQLQEAKRRTEAGEPPGFRDADKEHPHGDYFVWSQALNEAKLRQAKVLLLVTSDTKEDWYQRVHGKTICARPELAEQAMRLAGCQLVTMATAGFLRHAKKHLNATVSQETLQQADRLRSQGKLSALAKPYQRKHEDLHRQRNHVRMRESRLTQEVAGIERELGALEYELLRLDSEIDEADQLRQMRPEASPEQYAQMASLADRRGEMAERRQDLTEKLSFLRHELTNLAMERLLIEAELSKLDRLLPKGPGPDLLHGHRAPDENQANEPQNRPTSL